MNIILPLILTLLFIPYLLWGIYILRLQLRFHEELEMKVKWATVGGLTLFFVVELFFMRKWVGDDSGYYLLTSLGLMLSAVALYGHLIISLASQLVVDMIHPPEQHEAHHPDFAPAEALEEIGDYEGALNEYLVIGRIYPKEPDPVLRVADAYIHLDKTMQALKYFSKGLLLINNPNRALRITNRIAGIYTRTLEQPDMAKQVLCDFLERFPNADECTSVQRRLDAMDKPKEKEKEEVFQSTTGMLEPPPSDLLG